MSRTCSICDKPTEIRLQIDRDITMGRSNASIAREYKISPDSVRHHKKNHLHPQMAKKSEIRETVAQMDVFKELDTLMEETREILKKAKRKGHNAIALHSIQQLRANITLYAQIRAEMHKQSMEMQGISPEELEQFRAWKEGVLNPDVQLEEFIASLPDEYKDKLFLINLEKISGGVNSQALSTTQAQNTPVEELDDEDLFDGEFSNDTPEVEEDTSEATIVEESPPNDTEPVEEEPPMRAGVMPEPTVVFEPHRRMRRRV